MRRHARVPRQRPRRSTHARTPAPHAATVCAVACAACLALALAAAPAPAAPSAQAAACPAAAAAAGGAGAGPRATLRCAINAERARHGLAALGGDVRLARAARRHARDMVQRRYFGHERAGWTLAGRLRAAGWTGARAGEAIAWGCGATGTPPATLAAWLASPPHRAIVLGRYRRAGVGLAGRAPTVQCAGGATWVLDAGA